MPIYEFYCADCHTLFSFLARRTGVRRRPDCPRCARPRLERRASVFAIARGRGDDRDDEADPVAASGPALDRLAAEIDSVNEDDPRQVGGLMRRLFDASGVPMGDAMREAVRRMERGEDPDAIEAELGEALETEEAGFDGDAADPGGSGRLRSLRRRTLPPRVDRTLYELEPREER